MEIIYLPKADDDLNFWVQTGNKIILKKIAQLTEAIIENPFEGIGKPEPLRYELAGNGQEEFRQNIGSYIRL